MTATNLTSRSKAGNALAPASLSIAAQAGRLQIHGQTNSMMGNMANKGNMRSTNFSSPEVALRDPIEQDFSLNRRLANQIYARDKMDGARERREAQDEIKRETAKKLMKKRDEETKKREKDFKESRQRQ